MHVRKHDTPCHEPTVASILHRLGIVAYDCEKIEVALRFMSMACAQPEAPAQCHRNHAEMLHRCGQLDKAEAAARFAIQCDSDCADAWDTLGTILFDRGAVAESRDCYQRAVQIKPSFLSALNNLAVVLHNLGEFHASEGCYRKALKLQSDNLEIQLNFANLLGELKRSGEALELTERILDRRPKSNKLYRVALELKRKLERAASTQIGAEPILRVAIGQKGRKPRRANIPLEACRSNRRS